MVIEKIHGISTEVLIWARETAGMSTAEASKKLGIKLERLNALENGSDQPTRTTLICNH